MKSTLFLCFWLFALASSLPATIPKVQPEDIEKQELSAFNKYLESIHVAKKIEDMEQKELEGHVVHYLHTKISKPEEKFSAAGAVISTDIPDSPLVDFNTPQLIEYYGYPAETHYVTTNDGYQLELHRIPHGKSKTDGPREPVIIQHGILCSSADWIMNPPDMAIGYMMADAGYDVWLPNLRGNTYSRNHTDLNPNRKEFWQFSWNEMGESDMTAIIDFILGQTGYSELYYVGHSMGTTIFFVMMDKYPEYNQKVNSFYAMAPVTAVDNMKSPVHFLAPFVDILSWWADFIHLYEFTPSNWLMDLVATTLCDDDDITQFICKDILFLLCGFNEKQLNSTMLPIYFSHTPAGESMKTLEHYGQTMQSALFRHFDYGRRQNEKVYGQKTPPNYDLGKTTCDSYLYFGLNDWMADPMDVSETAAALPNMKLLHQVQDDKWSHADFMWGIQANSLVYDKIISEIKMRTLK